MFPPGALTPYDVTQTVTVTGDGLVLTSSPDDIIAWDPATMSSVNISSAYVDAQEGTCSLTYDIYSTAGNLVFTKQVTNLDRPGNDTWAWTGLNSSNLPVEKGLYVVKSTVTSNIPTMTSDSNRSGYLQLLAPLDEYGQPIYEASCEGIDDNGTPNDDTDDNYIYYVKSYNLKDTLGSNASEGEIWLYNPDLTKVGTWNIANLHCRIHDASDGLNASTSGITHELLILVPISVMQDEGIYRFVAHVKDDHADQYRDHERKWAIDLNQIGKKKKLTLETDWMVGVAPTCPDEYHEIIEPGLFAAFAMANYNLEVLPNHDSNCIHVADMGALSDDDRKDYVRQYLTYNPYSDLYLIGCHQFIVNQNYEATGYTVIGSGGFPDQCMVFMHARGGLNIFYRTNAELHECAAHDSTVGAIGHCSNNLCPCYGELNYGSKFCNNCLSELRNFNQ